MRKLAISLVILIAAAGGLFAQTPTNRTFSGRVLNPQGKPAEGVEISAFLRESRSLNSRLKPAGTSVRTDKDGNFRISDLQPSMVYTIVLRGHGYLRQRWDVIGSRYLTMRVQRANGSLSGRVVDRNGSPVQGVWIKVGKGVDSLYTCRTGGDGGFSFSDLVPGAFVAVCVGDDTFTQGAQVGDKDVKIIVAPDRVKDFKPLFPDDGKSSLLSELWHKIVDR
jgi:hypothetical protein